MASTTYQALSRGETVEIEGLQLRGKPADQLRIGDMYVSAQTGSKLFTVARLESEDVIAVQGNNRGTLAHSLRVEVIGITADFEADAPLRF